MDPSYEQCKTNGKWGYIQIVECGVDQGLCKDINRVYLGASTLVFAGATDPASFETLIYHEAMDLATDLMQT